MKLYTSKAIDDLIDIYVEKGGDFCQIQEGILGHGEMLIFGDGLKYAVIKEVFINTWSSGHTIRFYNILPKKYQKAIELI